MRGIKWTAVVVVAASAGVLTRWAAADDCNRTCAPGQVRDERGCCPAAPAAPRPSTPKPSSTSSSTAAATCSPGKSITADTAGHCCWDGQIWLNGCTGTPNSCPAGYSPTTTGCALDACEAGLVRAQDNVHCCWPGQGWSVASAVCKGPPQCPSGYEVSGETCVAPVVQVTGSTPAAITSRTLGTLRGIPAGRIQMGSAANEAGHQGDETQHAVTISRGYYLMESEVTQAMWTAVMGSNPSYFDSCGPSCPVEQVSWDDARAFAAKVSAAEGVTYRLPTEAEWEWAARGGQATTYAGSENAAAVAWTSDNAGGKTHQVCTTQQRNGFNLCDMSGNVWEWTQDWYGSYPSGSVTDPVGASGGAYRVNRGGSWNNGPSYARVAYRYYGDPGNRRSNLGFRLARSIP